MTPRTRWACGEHEGRGDDAGRTRRRRPPHPIANHDREPRSLLFVALAAALAVQGCAGPAPRIEIDREQLWVRVRDIEVDLVRDCGIETSLLRRDFAALHQWTGGREWRIMVMLNEIPAVEIWTGERRFECGIASKAYGKPAE